MFIIPFLFIVLINQTFQKSFTPNCLFLQLNCVSLSYQFSGGNRKKFYQIGNIDYICIYYNYHSINELANMAKVIQFIWSSHYICCPYVLQSGGHSEAQTVTGQLCCAAFSIFFFCKVKIPPLVSSRDAYSYNNPIFVGMHIPTIILLLRRYFRETYETITHEPYNIWLPDNIQGAKWIS